MTTSLQTFSDAEMKLIRKLAAQPQQAILTIRKPCPQHSVCSPLPLFRVYKIDDESFEAQWNGYHEPGVKQVFRFDEILQSR
jgi:hypothetical protein